MRNDLSIGDWVDVTVPGRAGRYQVCGFAYTNTGQLLVAVRGEPLLYFYAKDCTPVVQRWCTVV